MTSLRRRLASLRRPMTGQPRETSATHGEIADPEQGAQGPEDDPVEAALAESRTASAAGGLSPAALLDHARLLVSRSAGSAAEEVLGLSLARQGAQADALELYLELVRELDLPASRTAWALDRLAEDISAHPEEHRGALDYAIPHRLDPVLSAIEAAGDPVDRAIIALERAYREHGTASPEALAEARGVLGENDLVRAHLTVVLGRGNREMADELLRDADPRAVPINALRRAIRRARANGKRLQLLRYLEAYRALRPDDGWATALQEEAEAYAVSNHQLARTGFPFPPPADAPPYSPQPDHVLYLLHNSLPHHSAGYATRTHGLLTELNRSGWAVDGVTRLGYPYDMPGKADLPDLPPAETIGEVTYRRLLAGREIERKNPVLAYTERYGAALAELSRETRPALLHAASNHWNGLTAVATARRLGIPSIYEVRGLWEITRGSRDPAWADSGMFRFMARMEADAARGATRAVTITEALRGEMIDRGVPEETISVVPNGVDTRRFIPLERDQELAARLGVAGLTVIGYVGSVLDYEGIGLLLEAAEALDRVREDFHVLIVGDGAELDRFRRQVRESGLGHVVTFTGRVPHEEVEQYYSLVDIAPFPRLPLPVCEMVSPLKPFEAMAMGKAVLASDVAALAEIVTPDGNGLLHTKGDVESLTEQLALLLDDEGLRRRLGERSRAWVVENRDWSVLATRIADLYEELA